MSQTRVPTTLTSALPTIAAMQGIVSPTTGMSVEVVEAGRGGTFVYDATRVAENDGGTVFDGWVRQYSGPLNIRWFGAQSTTDVPNFNSTTHIQTALTLGWSTKQNVFMPAGTYRITDTLEITSPTIQYQSARVFGESRGYTQPAQARTIIDASEILNKPAIHISAGLGVILEDFLVEGPNTAPGDNPDIFQGSNWYEFDWVTPGVRDSRYSPQCGICVDGNTGAIPPDGGYPGFVYRDDTRASADLIFNRITFRHHVVGLMLCPSLTLNADQISIENCSFVLNKVAVAAGQSQTKGTMFYGGNFLRQRTCYDGLTYGQQQGRGPNFVGTQFLQAFEIISWNSAFGPATFYGCFIEQCYRIGYAGTAVTIGSGIHFYGCQIMFHGYDVPLGILGSKIAPIQFEGPWCLFTWNGGSFGTVPTATDSNNQAYNFIAAKTIFDGAEISFHNKNRPFIQGPAGLKYPVALRDVKAIQAGATPVIYGDRVVAETDIPARIPAHHGTPTLSVLRYNTSSLKYNYVREVNAGEIAAPGVSSNYVFTNESFSFNNTDAAGGFIVGDILYWKMKPQGASTLQWLVAAFRVSAVAAPLVTCEYLFRRVDYDETYVPENAVPDAEKVYIAVPHWAPGKALTADTNATTTISNVSPVDTLQNGDWIMARSGIGLDTRVLSGGGTATITLSRAATNTEVGKSLYFDRLHLEKTAPAFTNLAPSLTASATPAVFGGETFKTSGATSITDFTFGTVGQTIKILATVGITITNGATIKLSGAVNFVMTADDTLTLTMFDEGVWQEVSRSVN